jgi:putative ABC transport system permease protein
MKVLLMLATRSAWNRRFVLCLVSLSIALSTFLLYGIERIRMDVRKGFLDSVSGTDLIVGSRTGTVQLLLYSVFRIGSATNNIRWSSAQEIANHPAVDWMIPISLGDQHRGYPVVATDQTYFDKYRFGDREALKVLTGQRFHALFDAVIGAEVAARLGYRLGDSISFTHGDGLIPGSEHANMPFTIVGILEHTGTQVDRSIHISLQAMEAIHLDWLGGVAPSPSESMSAAEAAQHDLTPKQVTAVLIGLKRRSAVFSMQRRVATFEREPLMAILPGVALDELWALLGAGERGLLAMSGLVSLVSLGGLVAVILAGMNERRRELAILRAVGAGPREVLMLLTFEGLLITLSGLLLGILGLLAAVASLGTWFEARFGIVVRLASPTERELVLLAAILLAGWLASLVPGVRAYRLSLTDGLQPKT